MQNHIDIVIFSVSIDDVHKLVRNNRKQDCLLILDFVLQFVGCCLNFRFQILNEFFIFLFIGFFALVFKLFQLFNAFTLQFFKIAVNALTVFALFKNFIRIDNRQRLGESCCVQK